jgi:hypothetical protein
MKIAEYKEYLLEHKFFEAHEVLEEYWFARRKQKDNLTLIVKGFINAAVSLELYKRGRVENSAKVWRVYKKYVKLIDKIDNQELKELKNFVDGVYNRYIKL